MNLPIKTPEPASVIEAVVAKGDLALLTPTERNSYYLSVCNSIGLNPLTRPFEYIKLNGKLVLYAKRDAADQLRKLNGISVEVVSQKVADNTLTVHVRARDKDGRTDEDFGSVPFNPQVQGEARANAVMKAVTKAKRRVTLSICGLGFLDETETGDFERRPAPVAENVMLPPHDPQTGEVVEPDARELSEMADAGEPDITEALTEFDTKLAAAAKRGIDALQAEWANVPPKYQHQLKAALDRRHKPEALKADLRAEDIPV